MFEQFLHKPLSTKTRELQQYFRSREGELYDEVQQLAFELGLPGRGVILDRFEMPVSDKFTGLGLCLLVVKMEQEALKRDYPDIKTALVAAQVNPRDTFRKKSHRIGHFWLRLELPENGNKLFRDPTFGQIHPFLNRPVLDFMENEPQYYGEGMQVFPYPDNKSFRQIYEETLKKRKGNC